MEAYVLLARGEEDKEEQQEEDVVTCASSGSSLASDEVELADAAASSTSTAHFEMASLITHLPIKRGLSKFFDGKSQSFASLAAVRGLEDLPKPPPAKRLKTSRSCGVGLEDARSAPAGGNKASRARLSSSPAPRKLTMRTRPPVTARRPEAVAGGQPLLFA